MKNTVFTGAATAIITPMTETGVDTEALGRLIDFQLEKGIDAIVAAGTTGEGSTLTDREHEELIGFCVKRIAGRVPVIAGTGSNNTAHAIERTVTACKAGADAVLLVTPYYNKTTQRGLIASFSAIADASSVPCILYNVPSRTGLNMLPETLKVLAEHERIVGVKEACGNISQVAKELELCGDKLDVYSGNDDQTVPILMRLLRLMNHLMIETNPIPVKAACAAMGFGKYILRLPLVEMEAENRAKLIELMKEQGLEADA